MLPRRADAHVVLRARLQVAVDAAHGELRVRSMPASRRAHVRARASRHTWSPARALRVWSGALAVAGAASPELPPPDFAPEGIAMQLEVSWWHDESGPVGRLEKRAAARMSRRSGRLERKGARAAGPGADVLNE
jgi:hypothetical protein